MLSVLILSVLMLDVIVLSLITLDAIILTVAMLSFVKLSVVMSIVMLHTLLLSQFTVIILNAVTLRRRHAQSGKCHYADCRRFQCRGSLIINSSAQWSSL